MDLSAYRILQEALSNAMRHAPGSAVRVELAYAPSSVVIKVRNDAGLAGVAAAGRIAPGRRGTRNGVHPGDLAGPTRHGQGIIGMRERATMLGGHLDAAPTEDGGFLVTAVLPDTKDPRGRPAVTMRVVIADDQGMVRSGFTTLLNSEPDIEVVGEAVNGQEAVARAAQLQPGRDPDGRPHAGAGRPAGHPADHRPAAAAPKVLVLTTFDLDDYVYQALRWGASGFLLKDASARELADAVRVVAAGDALLAPGVTRRLIAEFARMGAPRGPEPQDSCEELTERESEVLALVARGLSNAEIAGHLVVAEQTVKTHVSRILMKLGLRDRTQAVVLAYETGLVLPGG